MSASHLEQLAETGLIPVHDYLLTGDPSAKTQFNQTSSQLDAEVAALQGKPSTSSGAAMPGMSTGDVATAQTTTKLSPEQSVLVQNFHDMWMEMHDQAEAIFKISDPVGNADAIAQLKAMEASANTMAAYAQSIHEFQMETVSRNQDSVNAIINNTSLFLGGDVMVAFLLGALLSRLIGGAISRPVAHLTQMSSNISLGDLDTKVEVQAGGEIGELAGAIERMRTSLKMIIERLSDEEEDLRTWTAQLAARTTAESPRWVHRFGRPEV
jgi:methyl-accepting chemotaxis protein